jgi:hypothetical protein
MTRQDPTTETITSAVAREQWDEVIDRVKTREARFVIECDGKQVAALISVHDLEIFERYLRQRAKDFEIVYEIQGLFADIPDDEIEREIEKAIAEVRAENRQRTDDPASVSAS